MFRSAYSPMMISTLLLSSIAIAIPFAQAGSGTSGGGDAYTLDFVQTATQFVYPWLVQNGAKLLPPVDPSTFLLSINPASIETLDRVYESCDETNSGREVQACYNSNTGKTYLSRNNYPVNSNSPSKVGLVAHEIFRKMGIEGDGYEITKQMSIAQDATIITATKTITTPDCYPTYNGAALGNVHTELLKADSNPACDEAVSNYYKTANKPITQQSILQQFHDTAQVVKSVAPDGTKCSNPNYYIGFITFHCTLSVQ